MLNFSMVFTSSLKGHFDETLGAIFFYFLKLRFLKYIPVKYRDKILSRAFKAPIENSHFTATIDLSLFFNCEQRSVVTSFSHFLSAVTASDI